MISICHFSDWHGKTQPLPEADLYVCTGDMLPNTPPPPWGQRWPNAVLEEPFQQKWIAEHVDEYAALAPKSRTPLVVVRGNHDFVDLAPLFVGWNGMVRELVDPCVGKWEGLTFGGFRGVPTINDCWADECTERQLKLKCDTLAELGKIDVFITHGPAFGWFDDVAHGKYIGSRAQREFILANDPKAHLFGHVHECGGQQKSVGGTIFSNAATAVNVVEIS